MRRILLCLCLLLAGCAGSPASGSEVPAEPPLSAAQSAGENGTAVCTIDGVACHLAREQASTAFEAHPGAPFTWSFLFHGGPLTVELETPASAFASFDIKGDVDCPNARTVVQLAGTGRTSFECGSVAGGNLTLVIVPDGFSSGNLTVPGARDL